MKTSAPGSTEVPAHQAATGPWPNGTRFRVGGQVIEWEEAHLTPTRVRLRRWQQVGPPVVFPGEWPLVADISKTSFEAVDRYVAADTPLQVLLPPKR